MVNTGVGKEVEKRFDKELGKLWNCNRYRDYLFEIVAPGTRLEADFQVQVNIYKKTYNPDGTITLKKENYVKVPESNLESLAVPQYFLKIGKKIKEHIDYIESMEKKT